MAQPAKPLGRLLNSRHWIAASSIGLFILLFAARGGKWEIAAGAASALLFFLSASALVHFPDDNFNRRPILLATAAFFCWTLFSLFHSGNILPGLIPLLKIAGCAAFWIVASLTWGKKERAFFKFFLWGAASLQAVMILAGHMKGVPLQLLLPGNPLYMALWLTLASLAALDSAFTSGDLRGRMGSSIFAAFLAVILFLLPSRSGVLAWAAGAFALSLLRFRWRGAFYAMALAFLSLALVPNFLWKQSLKLTDPLAWKRSDIWISTVNGIAEKPLLGWGPGNFGTLYAVEALPQTSLPVRYDRSTPFAHNDFLQSASEFGLPALVFLILGLVGALASGMQRDQKSFLIATSVFSLFNFPFFLSVNGWLLAGLLSDERDGHASSRLESAFNRGLVAIMVLCGLISLGIAAFRTTAHFHRFPETWVDPWDISRAIDQSDTMLHENSAARSDAASQAEIILRRVLKFSPDNARAWRDLSHLQSDHSEPPRLEESRQAIVRALSLNPHQAIWTLEMGALALRQGDRPTAYSAAHQALDLEPDYAEAALFLGSVLRESNESARGEKWLSDYLHRHRTVNGATDTLSPYAQAILHLDADAFRLEIARCQLAQKAFSKALATLSQVADDPQGMRSFEQAGVYYAMGKYGMAEKSLLNALRSDKNNPAFIRNLDLVRRKNKL